jgi:hypothetical protein
MISPMTAPGTKIVAIDTCEGPGPIPDLIVGKVYTLDEIVESCDGTGLGVRLQEVDHSRLWAPKWWKPWARVHCVYGVEDFELAALPGCLTEILVRAPAPSRKATAR